MRFTGTLIRSGVAVGFSLVPSLLAVEAFCKGSVFLLPVLDASV